MTTPLQAAVRLSAATCFAMTLAATAASASKWDERVQKNCQDDYLKYCSAEPVGSTTMRRCMEANGKKLSKTCVNTLVDAGEIPRNLRR